MNWEKDTAVYKLRQWANILEGYTSEYRITEQNKVTWKPPRSGNRLPCWEMEQTPTQENKHGWTRNQKGEGANSQITLTKMLFSILGANHYG